MFRCLILILEQYAIAEFEGIPTDNHLIDLKLLIFLLSNNKNYH